MWTTDLCLVTLVSLTHVFGAVSSGPNSLTLPHSTVLDADNKYHIAWDFSGQSITFEVSVETLGYIGLGFSPNGGMAHSDIVIGWVEDSTGQAFLSDRHAVDRSEPVVDDRQDYTLLTGHQNDTHTVLRFSRKLDLCGSDDHFLVNETVRLIWAYHDTDPGVGGSIRYHAAHRGNKNLFLLNPHRKQPTLPDNVVYHDFVNPQVAVPSDDTTYWCQAFPVPKLDRKHHIIKMEPLIQPGHESLLHHMLFFACYHDVSNDTFDKGHVCGQPNMPPDFWGCDTVVLAWAVGLEELYFPEHVGLPLGYDGDPTMFILETHYDNPQRKQGLVDSSGFRITLTPDLREYDAGVLLMGETVGKGQIIPPFAESFRTPGHCYPECLAQALESQPQGFHVFGSILHAHLLAHAVRIRHFRNSIEQPLIDENNNYDFNFHETKMLSNEVSILSGDNFSVECDYRTTRQTEVTHGGLSSYDEMCLGFLFYYPKVDLSKCQSTPSPQYLASFVGAEVSGEGNITSPPKYAGRAVYDVINSDVDWTDKSVRDDFQTWVSRDDVDGFQVDCFFGKQKYPIHGKVMPLPPKVSTLPEVQRCAGGRIHLTGLLFFLNLFLIATVL